MAQVETMNAINSFIVGLKADGVWSKITEAYLLAGVTFGGITVKLKGTGTLTNNNFVSGDYQATGAGAGLTGDGSTKYINTNAKSSLTPADDKTLSYYATQIGSKGIIVGIRGSDTENKTFQLFRNAYRFPATTAANFGIAPNREHFFLVTRRGINDVEAYENGISVHTDTNTSAAENEEIRSMWLFGNGAYTGGENSDGTLTFAHIGTGLTDTDASNLTNRVETLMDALGCGVIT